jgi:hypothetical protein
MMLTKIIVFVCLIAPLAEGFGGSDVIDTIRSHFQWINSQSDYEVFEVDGEDYLEFTPDNGALLKGFYKNGKLFKIVETTGLSYAMIMDEYYLWDDKLFFVYHREETYIERYDASGNFLELDYSALDLKHEARTYVNDGDVIKVLEKGKSVMSGDYSVDLSRKVASLRSCLEQIRWTKMIQGRWVSTQDRQYTVDFVDMTRVEYYSGERMDVMNIRIDHGYLYCTTRGEEPEELKYQITGLTETRLSLLYLPVGRILEFDKVH